jgi:hypothetical protein
VHVTFGSVAVSAPPRVRDRLRSAPDGTRPVLHTGRHAVYVDLDGWCLGVVGRDAAQVPNALRLASADLAALGGAAEPVVARVVGGVLHLDGTPLRVGRLVQTRVPRVDLRGAPLTILPTDHPSVPAEVVGLAGECALPTGARRPLGPGDVARLVGRGGGLTPLGDDVLCGWLATHRAAGHATPAVDATVGALLGRTTLLSATLLDCALHGEVLPEFAGYLAAVGTPHEPGRAAALAAVGHTSGAGLLLGALIARTELDHANGVAA